ncbi:MAG: ATP-binding protein [Coleofasciculus sp. G1-WW12-02]|uniref:AAA family ATPase n=1 Tax=Coleofasciculus sp. G1-WW12-02 TaxID=3068483 RepID=UPI0032FD5FCD
MSQDVINQDAIKQDESQQDNEVSVPRLDLAPKLKRPLSLWNPLDYLRLLYWVFYFPQALRWYVNTFGGGYIPPKEMNWRKGLEQLRQNPIQRQLFIKGLVLTVLTPLIIGLIILKIGILIDLFYVLYGLLLGLFLNIFLSVGLGVVIGVTLGLAVAVASGLTWGLAWGTANSVAWGLAFGLVCSVAWGLASGVELKFGLKGRDGLLKDNLSYEPALDIIFLIQCIVWGTLALYFIEIAPLIIVVPAQYAAFLFAWGFAIRRPDNWLLNFIFITIRDCNSSWMFPHLTPLHQPNLFINLTNWLRQDWKMGIQNANQLLAYTYQFMPVICAVNMVLADTPSNQVLYRVVQLAEVPYDWKLLRFASEELSTRTKSRVVDLSLDTPARAAAAGFWYLHEKEPAKATEAFAVVRSLLYGEELFTLAQTLTTFNDAKEPATIATLELPTSPNEPLLRPITWNTINALSRVVEDVRVVQRSVSRSTRAFALTRTLGELETILNHIETLPEAERELIKDIAQTWQDALLQIATEIGQISISQPVTNPYVVGDPVEGNRFVGRDDILRQLEELWVMGQQLQSVVLYGHRRMGKTSILLNVANCSGSRVKVVYINLLRLGSPQGVGEVLMAISDAISDAIGCPPPDDDALLNLPYRTFERYFKQVVEILRETSVQGLIIALDEFEKIEELIEAGKIPNDFIGYLRGLVQMNAQVAFVFAGLHTLEEMTADYFQPFFASVIPIHVGFLEPAATRQILANPSLENPDSTVSDVPDSEAVDFPLDYTPDALDLIYRLTAGQPYLVQLVGFQLVRRYNDFVFEQGHSRDPVFTVEDVEAVINNPAFYQRGRYYFDGVWGQAARGVAGQQAILKVLAPHPDGLMIEQLRIKLAELFRESGLAPLEEKQLEEALETLIRHDVIQQKGEYWQIIVELFRRWVLNQ